MGSGTDLSAKNPTSGVLWAVATAMAYSMSSVVGKDLLGVLAPSSLLFWRFGISTLVLWSALALWRRRGGPDPLDVPRLKAFGVGVMFGYMVITGFFALQHLDASVYIVIVYLYPVLVVVGSSLLGHRVTGGMWLALAVVMTGVVLTVPELFGGVGGVSGVGIALTLLQAVLMAVFMMVSSHLLPGLDGVVNSAWTMLGAFTSMVPLVLVNGLEVPHGTKRIGELLLFALVTGVVSTVCFFRAMRHIAPGVVAMIMTLEVALAILWSVLFLGEKVSAIKLVGAAVVMGGVLVAQWSNLRDARAAREVDPFSADLAV
ncbi:MAG: DMT family transporter [Actinomycetota bacterium]